MAKAELTLTSNRGGAQAPTGGQVPADVADALRQSPRRAVPQPPAGPINAKTQNLHAEQHQRNAAAADNDGESLLAELAEAVKPREDVESIELQLPDGRVVLFGPPPGVSLTARVAMLMAGQPASDELDMVTRVLLCIRSIDDKRMPPITNRVDVQKCANLVGDNGLDVLGYMLKEHWPAVKLGELPMIKKNLRGSNL